MTPKQRLKKLQQATETLEGGALNPLAAIVRSCAATGVERTVLDELHRLSETLRRHYEALTNGED